MSTRVELPVVEAKRRRSRTNIRERKTGVFLLTSIAHVAAFIRVLKTDFFSQIYSVNNRLDGTRR